MLSTKLRYIPDLYSYQRRPTRMVMVGKVGVGGDNPIRVQSMTTTLTKDIEATAAQAERLARVGCEIIRITTPMPADARCLGPIRDLLTARGIDVPIVADIHFSPAAALEAADYADKVRVNPGNYADSRKFAIREYSDEEYEAELGRVEGRFTPLVLKCKERRIAMRIGTNHGSLSDRIMNRFGDTPEGMVESALEFVRICEKHDYRDLILSMKASNPKVMIAAYRLLAARMAELGMDYPFHLGVTEAGNAEEGRIKSAIGIGSLLEDGIGDTIRVSLTEEPEEEVPVGFALAGRRHDQSPVRPASEGDAPWDCFHFERRLAQQIEIGSVPLGDSNPVAVLAPIAAGLSKQPEAMARVLRWASPAGKRQPKPEGAVVRIEDDADAESLQRISERLAKWPQAQLALIADCANLELARKASPWIDAIWLAISSDDGEGLVTLIKESGKPLILEAEVGGPRDRETIDWLVAAALSLSPYQPHLMLALKAPESEAIHAYRLLVTTAQESGLETPILIRAQAGADPLLSTSITIGSLLCDGAGDAIMIDGLADSSDLAFNVLQAAGTRIFKTDYVACPSCGRTLFDLQETTDRIKEKTSHLVGVKLAIMGCIVNGPGEMADADFGYVGGAPGQVNLYVGKECVEKGVPAEEADERLVALIKSHGRWQEPD